MFSLTSYASLVELAMDADEIAAEEAIFDLILSGGAGGGDAALDRDANEELDIDADEYSSQFLNPSGEGMEQEPTDEGQTNKNDEENVGPSQKSGEVYISSSGIASDHYMYFKLNYIYINESFFF